MRYTKKLLFIVLCTAFLFTSYGCKAYQREDDASKQESEAYFMEEETYAEDQTDISTESDTHMDLRPDKDGVFDDQYEVAMYIYYYETLPKNYITKKEAKSLGWEGGSLEEYAPGKCIGGDYFGNYEALLPEEDEYRECDIDTLGKDSRGAKRIVYSEDGDVYYTDDHYESFTEAYFEEDEKGGVTVSFKEME